MHCIGFSLAEGNWPCQLLTVSACCYQFTRCPLHRIGGDTSLLLEFLFEKTNVFFLLNINSRYGCDWNDEAVYLREGATGSIDDPISASWQLVPDTRVPLCLTVPGNKRTICKRRIYLCRYRFCWVFIPFNKQTYKKVNLPSVIQKGY